MEELIKGNKLPREREEGNIEYKRQLCDLSQSKISKLATQMKWRLSEGDGKAIYFIGINDNGTIYGLNNQEMEESLNNIVNMVLEINAIITEIKINKINNNKVAKVSIINSPHWSRDIVSFN